MIGYVSCNSGAGFAAKQIEIGISLSQQASFGIMKIGVFGEDGAAASSSGGSSGSSSGAPTDSCSGPTTVTADPSFAGSSLTFDLL